MAVYECHAKGKGLDAIRYATVAKISQDTYHFLRTVDNFGIKLGSESTMCSHGGSRIHIRSELGRKRSDILVEVYERKFLWLGDSIRITS